MNKVPTKDPNKQKIWYLIQSNIDIISNDRNINTNVNVLNSFLKGQKRDIFDLGIFYESNQPSPRFILPLDSRKYSTFKLFPHHGSLQGTKLFSEIPWI